MAIVTPLTIDECTAENTRLLARSPVTRRTLLRAAAGGYAIGQFHLAKAAFAAGGGAAGPSGVVVSGRHLSFVQGADGALRPAMAVGPGRCTTTGSGSPTGRSAATRISPPRRRPVRPRRSRSPRSPTSGRTPRRPIRVTPGARTRRR
jgi:hypothetical protein